MRTIFASLVLLLATAVTLSSDSQDPYWLDMHMRIISFEKSYDLFVRRFYGCPEDRTVPVGPESCTPARGRIDYRTYSAAREAAKRLFALADLQKARRD
jgi:hypothetical protein